MEIVVEIVTLFVGRKGKVIKTIKLIDYIYFYMSNVYMMIFILIDIDLFFSL